MFTYMSQQHDGVTSVGVQTQRVHMFQGRSVWIRNVSRINRDTK